MLGIETKKGQKKLAQERKAMKKFAQRYGLTYVETEKDKTAKLDGIMMKDDEIVVAAESKVRNMSEQDLKNFGTYLISNHKIEAGERSIGLLRAPYVAFAYLLEDDVMYTWKIINAQGEYLFDYETERRKTQATVNGGTKIDTVALLPIEYGRRHDLS